MSTITISEVEYRRLVKRDTQYWELRAVMFGAINELSRGQIHEMPAVALSVVSKLKDTLDRETPNDNTMG